MDKLENMQQARAGNRMCIVHFTENMPKLLQNCFKNNIIWKKLDKPYLNADRYALFRHFEN